MAANQGNDGGEISVSVVLYVHNGEPYLTEAVDSILDQTHEAFELCVVDDGSTDGTAKILEEYARRDGRVRVQRQAARGRDHLHETFNACLAMAGHDLVAIANADDIWRPHKLERQLEAFAADPELDICFHEATFIDADGCVLWGGFRRYDSPYDTAPPRPWRFISGNPVPNPTVMFKRGIVRRIGLQEVGQMHDYQFWFKATIAGCRFRGLPDRLMRYRIHEGSHSTAATRRELIRDAHRECSAAMVERHQIDELVPELQMIDSADIDSFAWAYSFVAGLLWQDGAFSAAGEVWREARRLSDDPSIVCGLGLVALRDGNGSDAARLLRLAADAGVGHAHAALAGTISNDTTYPPKWHGREPAIASLVEQTDLDGLADEAVSCPQPFDVVLVIPDASSDSERSDRIAIDLVRHSNGEHARMVGLATTPEDIEVLATAYDQACLTDPTIGDRLYLEVDVVPVAQRDSVVAAHVLDGAAIAS